jgi:protein-S-isoprenylcysteine O-methyltransferase Ste14
MNRYERLFGSGPKGTFYGILLFMVAITFNESIVTLKITDNEFVRYTIFGVSTVATLFLIVWSLYSLPPSQREKKFVTTGAFKYFRHPLYAAFVSIFNFGFAVLLNSWIYFIWALLMIPVWQLCVRSEEKLMLEEFGDSYSEYSARTWKFFPKLYKSKHNNTLKGTANDAAP